MTTITRPQSELRSRNGEPAWEAAIRLPLQGQWDEEDYLRIFTERGVELVDGRIEVLPMPKATHQRVLAFLFKALSAFVDPGGLGEVLTAGMRVRCRTETIREPDIVFMRA